MIQIGTQVKILAPFDQVYPGVYTIVAQAVTGAWKIGVSDVIDECPDFDPEFLTVVA